VGKERIGDDCRAEFSESQCQLHATRDESVLSQCEFSDSEEFKILDKTAERRDRVGKQPGLGLEQVRAKQPTGPGEYIVEQILRSGCSSISQFVQTAAKEPRLREMMWKRNFDDLCRKAIDIAKSVVRTETFLDLAKQRYQNPDVYMDRGQCASPQESFKWMARILEYNNIDFYDFVSDVIKTMDKVEAKINTLWLKGDPNGGKTQVAENCINCRSIVINEPHFTDEWVETLKNMMEGCETAIDVKYKTSQTLDRTPIIITSNVDLAMYIQHAKATAEQAFKARTKRYDFSTYPALKGFKLHLHPGLWYLAIRKLMLDHDIEDPSGVYCDMDVQIDLYGDIMRVVDNMD